MIAKNHRFLPLFVLLGSAAVAAPTPSQSDAGPPKKTTSECLQACFDTFLESASNCDESKPLGNCRIEFIIDGVPIFVTGAACVELCHSMAVDALEGCQAACLGSPG